MGFKQLLTDEFKKKIVTIIVTSVMGGLYFLLDYGYNKIKELEFVNDELITGYEKIDYNITTKDCSDIKFIITDKGYIKIL